MFCPNWLYVLSVNSWVSCVWIVILWRKLKIEIQIHYINYKRHLVKNHWKTWIWIELWYIVVTQYLYCEGSEGSTVCHYRSCDGASCAAAARPAPLLAGQTRMFADLHPTLTQHARTMTDSRRRWSAHYGHEPCGLWIESGCFAEFCSSSARTRLWATATATTRRVTERLISTLSWTGECVCVLERVGVSGVSRYGCVRFVPRQMWELYLNLHIFFYILCTSVKLSYKWILLISRMFILNMSWLGGLDVLPWCCLFLQVWQCVGTLGRDLWVCGAADQQVCQVSNAAYTEQYKRHLERFTTKIRSERQLMKKAL